MNEIFMRDFIKNINNFINNDNSFKETFNINLRIKVEDKAIFKKKCCGAITSGGTQCTRKNQKGSNFCGLHRSDDKAHRRKRNKTTRFLTISDNITTYSYRIKFDNMQKTINYENCIYLYDDGDKYLLDTTTNLLYSMKQSPPVRLGYFNEFSINFKYQEYQV